MRNYLLFIITSILIITPTQYTFAGFKFDNQKSFTDSVANASGVVQSDVPSIVGSLARGMFAVLGLAFFIIVFYGGFRWITARGNGDQVSQAQKTVTAAFIGLIIVLASYAITAFLERII